MQALATTGGPVITGRNPLRVDPSSNHEKLGRPGRSGLTLLLG